MEHKADQVRNQDEEEAKKTCLEESAKNYSNNWTLKYFLWESLPCPCATDIAYTQDKTETGDQSRVGALKSAMDPNLI